MAAQVQTPDTASDTDQTTVSVSLIVEAMKAAVKAARPADRRPMWEAFSAALAKAQDAAAGADGTRMPWETPAEVTALPSPAWLAPFEAAFYLIDDMEERARLVNICADSFDLLEAMGVGKDSSSDNQQSRPRCRYCGDPIPATRKAGSLYCRDAHKSAAYRARQGMTVMPDTGMAAMRATGVAREPFTAWPGAMG
jgi:hypothetical protein